MVHLGKNLHRRGGSATTWRQRSSRLVVYVVDADAKRTCGAPAAPDDQLEDKIVAEAAVSLLPPLVDDVRL